ncbi:MAG TPA: GIY-YIG nuclease family protein [Patescibacteria group bacterium]|nr:GIY-YIG nuclease family protein [Patescibacteria group bacterium]
MSKQGYTYILTNKRNTVLYTGVTSDLIQRIWQHKQKIISGFSKKYNLDKLVYYEVFDSISDAIKREKQLKSGSRNKKVKLIEQLNSRYHDLYHSLV